MMENFNDFLQQVAANDSEHHYSWLADQCQATQPEPNPIWLAEQLFKNFNTAQQTPATTPAAETAQATETATATATETATETEQTTATETAKETEPVPAPTTETGSFVYAYILLKRTKANEVYFRVQYHKCCE